MRNRHEASASYVPDLRAVAWFAVAVACMAIPALAWAAGAGRGLVPANVAPRADGMGFQWDIQPDGQVMDGSDDAFDSGLVLMVNGRPFQPTQAPMMTADGAEYVLTSKLGNIEVTRRVKVDAKAAAVRYIDSARNTGNAAASVSLMVNSPLGGNCQTWVSDLGAPTPAGIGPKECGVLAIQRQGTSRPSILFCVAGPGSKVKPSLAVQNQTVFQFTYNLAVPAGRTASIFHAVAQRRVGGQPDPKTLAGLFQPMRSKAFIHDVPADLRRTIVNLGSFTGGGDGGGGVDERMLATLQKLGVERGTADILAVGEETRVRGTAACEQLSLSTRFGPIALPLEKVAAIAGGRYSGRRAQVFLRDGQVLSGKLEAKGLRFTLGTGIVMDLKAEALDRLMMHTATDDGKPAPDVALFVETFDGDRLAVLHTAKLNLQAITPWGALDIPLDDLAWLSVPEEGQPGHLVRMKDGSRFFAVLDGVPLKLKTVAFGERDFKTAEIRSIVSAGHKADEAEDGDPPYGGLPHVALVGDNVVQGRVDLAAIHFLSGGQVIPVPPVQIRSLANTGEGEAPAEPGGGSAFRAEMWGGGTVTGQIRETLLPVRVGQRVCQVPLRDIVSVTVPTPAVPDGLRDKIAQLIRDLGHPEWEKRDAASRQLSELGQVARPALAEAVKQTADPEVRRRAQTLLDEMGE